jgi:hypothetical protein
MQRVSSGQQSLAMNVSTVQAMWEAHNDGRVDDMVATMHRDVEWQPLSRPGLSLYAGHNGIRRMLADVAAANGEYTVLPESIFEPEPEHLIMRARVVRPAGPVAALEIRIEMRDGLIYRVDTLPA